MTLSPRERQLAWLAVAGAAAVLVWKVHLDPKLRGIVQASEEAEDLEDRVAKEERFLARDRKTAADWGRLSKKLDSGGPGVLMEAMAQACESSAGVRDHGNHGRNPADEKDFRVERRVYDDLSGNLASFVRFLAILDAQPILLALPVVSITCEDGRTFQVDIEVSTATSKAAPAAAADFRLAEAPAGRRAIDFARIDQKNVFAPYRERVERREPTDAPALRKVEVRERFTLCGAYWDGEEGVFRVLAEDQDQKVRPIGVGDRIGDMEVVEVNFAGVILTGIAESGAPVAVGLGEAIEGKVIGTRELGPVMAATGVPSIATPVVESGGPPTPEAPRLDPERRDKALESLAGRRKKKGGGS